MSDRIAKLRAVADHPNTGDAERANARAMVEKLTGEPYDRPTPPRPQRTVTHRVTTTATGSTKTWTTTAAANDMGAAADAFRRLFEQASDTNDAFDRWADLDRAAARKRERESRLTDQSRERQVCPACDFLRPCPDHL